MEYESYIIYPINRNLQTIILCMHTKEPRFAFHRNSIFFSFPRVEHVRSSNLSSLTLYRNFSLKIKSFMRFQRKPSLKSEGSIKNALSQVVKALISSVTHIPKKRLRYLVEILRVVEHSHKTKVLRNFLDFRYLSYNLFLISLGRTIFFASCSGCQPLTRNHFWPVVT